MAYLNESITIINGSPYTLILDKTGSSGLGDGDWPASIAPTSTGYVQQTGNVKVDPTAAYECEGANPPVTIYLHFYCAGTGLIRVNMTMKFSSGQPFPGSCIAEDNNRDNQKRCTPDELSIDHTDNGSVNGRATFTIGAP